jgi:hypothetical protein
VARADAGALSAAELCRYLAGEPAPDGDAAAAVDSEASSGLNPNLTLENSY